MHVRIALVALLLLSGCITFDGSGEIEVRVLVTTDLGTAVLHDQRVTLPAGASALDAVQAIAAVETAYGGGFVEAIDGRASRFPDARVDWFFHLNGRLGETGSADTALSAGDVVLWDHRPWTRTLAQPWILTGTGLAPERASVAAPEGPAALAALGDDPRLAVTLDGGTLVVLDAWGGPVRRIDAPWVLVHAPIEPQGAFLVVASSPDARGLARGIDTLTGLGVVLTPEGAVGVPA